MLYFLHSTLVLSCFIDVVLTLSIGWCYGLLPDGTNHYLNQCCLTMESVLGHSPRAISQEVLIDLIHKMCSEITLLKLPPYCPGGSKWVKQKISDFCSHSTGPRVDIETRCMALGLRWPASWCNHPYCSQNYIGFTGNQGLYSTRDKKLYHQILKPHSMGVDLSGGSQFWKTKSWR